MRLPRGILKRAAILAFSVAAIFGSVQLASADDIAVEGNSRVDSDTIRSYFTGTDAAHVAEGVKALKNTGLFKTVRTGGGGGHLVVQVTENNAINRVAFEGNSKIKSEVLQAEVQSKSRGVFDPALVTADVEHIHEVYRRAGRADATVSYRTVDLPNGKIDVVFTVDEGSKTGVKEINFTGNNAYSSRKLRGLMQTTEMNLFSFFKTSDVYDPDKIATDEELIRRYYLRTGYADFRIINTDVKYDPEEKGYIITIAVDEGQPYTVASATVDSRFPDVGSADLLPDVRLEAGDVYDGDQVEKTVEAVTRDMGRRGFAFAQVRPRGDRNAASHTVSIQFVVDDGPRVYIERINIHGNTRTRDYVIRREFDIGEGDPYNRVLIDRAERRLNGLGFFKKVRITNEPGSAPDRVVIDVAVEDQPTGSFSVSGGYSTTDGFIAEVSVTETNFLGRGDYVKVAAQEGENARGVDFSFTEPYIFDTRVAAGIDLFAKENDNTQYAEYSTFVTGGTLRFGVPVTDEFSISPHYSIYNTKITIPNRASLPYDDCNNPIDGTTPGFGALVGTLSATNNCLTNGEASVAIKQSRGNTLTSLAGVNLSYNTLDNLAAPTEGLLIELRDDVAGLGGDSQFFRNTGDLRYFHSVYEDVVGIVHLQGGNITGFADESKLRIADEFQLGPTLVRGFAPGGLGPRDISDLANYKYNPLGGSNYYGASVEFQFPLYGLPRDLGLKGAVFSDMGSLFGYSGKTNFTPGGGPCVVGGVAPAFTQGTCVTLRDNDVIRSSVGASILWQSPLGPLRFDYAYALTKDKFDVTQAFRFSGGTRF